MSCKQSATAANLEPLERGKKWQPFDQRSAFR